MLMQSLPEMLTNSRNAVEADMGSLIVTAATPKCKREVVIHIPERPALLNAK